MLSRPRRQFVYSFFFLVTKGIIYLPKDNFEDFIVKQPVVRSSNLAADREYILWTPLVFSRGSGIS